MEKKTFLSICIPTFGRADRLDHILGAIHCEIAGLPYKVQVCISDNGSKDNTQRIIRKWKGRLNIKSRRNPYNMGYDVNAAQVMRLADGEFAMYVGDDDTLAPGSLKRLVDDLRCHGQSGIGAIYLNNLKCGKPRTKFGFSEFRVFSDGSKDYPPLDLVFGGAICVRAAIAKRILAKKTRSRIMIGLRPFPLLQCSSLMLRSA